MKNGNSSKKKGGKCIAGNIHESIFSHQVPFNNIRLKTEVSKYKIRIVKGIRSAYFHETDITDGRKIPGDIILYTGPKSKKRLVKRIVLTLKVTRIIGYSSGNVNVPALRGYKSGYKN